MKNLFVLGFAILIGCSTTTNSQEITNINADKLLELQKSGLKVVDVRTPEEFAQGHIPGAVNIPLSQNTSAAMSEFPKEEAVVLYCRSGRRSTMAAEQLKESGYKTIYNYTGSFNDWLSSGRKVER